MTIRGDEFVGGDELLVVSADVLPTIAAHASEAALSANDLIQVTADEATRLLAPATVAGQAGAQGQTA